MEDSKIKKSKQKNAKIKNRGESIMSEINKTEISADNKTNNGEIKIREKKSDQITNKVIKNDRIFRINFEIDLLSAILFISALFTRMYKLDQPRNIVFDELHYGKYVALYMKNTFFFDSHPPLGKQLIAALAYLSNFDATKFKFDKIGSQYPNSINLFALRFIPAFFGSLIVPTSYHLMLEVGVAQSTAFLAAILILFDNALLTQSRFILMESMLIFFALFGILCILKFRKYINDPYAIYWFVWLILSVISLTLATLIKYAGFYSLFLGVYLMTMDFWSLLRSKLSDAALFMRFITQVFIVISLFSAIYLFIFHIHLSILYKAGPHDSIMTSAFQASLEGGLASITKGQPLLVAHGSQITLRHTHGRTCWLHSHTHVYPIRYPDKRGSSHQQQVTCYSFKDVNNWWIVKRPNKNDLVVEQPIDVIKHGEVVQLVHGITSRALNSHDVAAPVSPQCQEVSCYIDYNVSMSAQNLWRVEVLNRVETGDDSWHTIKSLVRLVHVGTNTALKFSGRQLPDWGFHQHEVVADKIVNQDDTIWNVEEHRYTKSEDQKERERDLVTAEMIPTSATKLSFWQKFYELHYKMLFAGTESVQNHMYSSEPLEWPLMSRGIAYWVSSSTNAQVHLLGNLLVWYSGTIGIALYLILLSFYLLRRRRLCYDLNEQNWQKFQLIGQVFLLGYFFHYLPYFFVERTLFLHHYLPAFTFKTLLLAAILDHVYAILKSVSHLRYIPNVFISLMLVWVAAVVHVFNKFLVLSYGTTDLSTKDIMDLRWKDTWDFIVHKS